jgi:CubicO group peptidase (beta-lactamase class C family)
MRGEVHDENAFALGGASGHAGLFGQADALLDFAQDVLAEGALGTTGLTPASITELRQRHAGTRSVGWEMAHPAWSGGDSCLPDTIGHTGFTGTGIWIDFAHGLAWTLLTNRVHPSRHTDSGILALRRAVGERVVRRDETSAPRDESL